MVSKPKKTKIKPKLIKLKDVLKDPTHPLMIDVKRNHATMTGDTLICIKCGKKYKRGHWDFYSLCDPCFIEFDSQKMVGRFSTFGGGKKTKYYESAEEWVKSLKNE